VFPGSEAVAVDRSAWESPLLARAGRPDVETLPSIIPSKLPARLEEICEEPVARPEETASSKDVGCAAAVPESWLKVTGTSAEATCGFWTASDTRAVWLASDGAFLLEWAARVAPDAPVVAPAASLVASVFDAVCPVFAEVDWFAEACARTLFAADGSRTFACSAVREEVRLRASAEAEAVDTPPSAAAKDIAAV
jgi:hypothetical protein